MRQRMQETHKHARINRHGTGDIANHHQVRQFIAWCHVFDALYFAKLSQGCFDRGFGIGQGAARGGMQATTRRVGCAECKCLNGLFSFTQLGHCHLIEVFVAQHIGFGDGQDCILLDLLSLWNGAVFLLIVKRISRASLRRGLFCCSVFIAQRRRQLIHHLLQKLGVAPEQCEHLMKHRQVLFMANQRRAQRVVKVDLAGESDRGHRLTGVL